MKSDAMRALMPCNIFERMSVGIVVVSMIFLAPLRLAGAQGRSPLGVVASEAEIKQYFEQKYGIREVRVFDKWNRIAGPLRSVMISDTFRPMRPEGGPATGDTWAIVKAFFQSEAQLLGLTDMSEIKKESRPGVKELDATNGYTSLRFNHYLAGIRIYGTDGTVTVSQDGRISWLDAGVVPIDDAMLHAVQQPTLSETTVRGLVRDDLEANNLDPKEVTWLEVQKVAIAIPPYVVWKVRGAGGVIYTFDAFTGAILDKLNDVQTLTPVHKDKP